MGETKHFNGPKRKTVSPFGHSQRSALSREARHSFRTIDMSMFRTIELHPEKCVRHRKNSMVLLRWITKCRLVKKTAPYLFPLTLGFISLQFWFFFVLLYNIVCLCVCYDSFYCNVTCDQVDARYSFSGRRPCIFVLKLTNGQ